VVLTAVLLALLTAFAVGYVAFAGSRSPSDGAAAQVEVFGPPAVSAPSPSSGPGSTGPVSPSASAPSEPAATVGRIPDGPRLLFVDARPGPNHLRLSATPLSAGNVADPTRRTTTELSCARAYAAGERVLCLRPTGGLVPAYQAVIFDRELREQQVIDTVGVPSRARLSADGAIASWTTFVSGDSYLSAGFSTRTSVLDLRTNQLVTTLEKLAVIKDGKPYTSSDLNYWGVTVARDDRTFYATLLTKGKTYLVRGDLELRQVTTIAENVECPSLSPDDTRLVFKKRLGDDARLGPWQLQVLDLATMKQTPLAEQRSVDDQATWLDDDTIAYSLPVEGIASYDLWTVPADGTGEPGLLLEAGTSPVAVPAT
jgi:hypothetical protein